MSVPKLAKASLEVVIRNPKVYHLLKSKHGSVLDEMLKHPVKAAPILVPSLFAILQRLDVPNKEENLWWDGSDRRYSVQKVYSLLSELRPRPRQCRFLEFDV